MNDDEKDFGEIYKTVMEKLDLHHPLKYYLDPDLLMKNTMRRVFFESRQTLREKEEKGGTNG